MTYVLLDPKDRLKRGDEYYGARCCTDSEDQSYCAMRWNPLPKGVIGHLVSDIFDEPVRRRI